MGTTGRLVSTCTHLLNRVIVLLAVWGVSYDLIMRAGPIDTGVCAKTVEWVLGQPILSLSVAALLTILNLNVIQLVLYSMAQTPGRAYITTRSDGGSSRVALSAIQKALKATASQLPEISKARVKVQRTGRHRFRVHVDYRVREARNAGATAEHLRLVLKKRFADLVLLDPKDRVDFDLDLAGIVKTGADILSQAQLPPPKDTIQTSPFKGPVYTVEGDKK